MGMGVVQVLFGRRFDGLVLRALRRLLSASDLPGSGTI
jgi:hypothetical protein